MKKKTTFLFFSLLTTIAFAIVAEPIWVSQVLKSAVPSKQITPAAINEQEGEKVTNPVATNAPTETLKVLDGQTLTVAANSIAGFNEGKIDFLVSAFKTVCNAQSVRYDATEQQFIITLQSVDDMKVAPEQVKQYLAVCQKSVDLLNKGKQDYINSNFGGKLTTSEIEQIKKEHGGNWIQKATELAKSR